MASRMSQEDKPGTSSGKWPTSWLRLVKDLPSFPLSKFAVVDVVASCCLPHFHLGFIFRIIAINKSKGLGIFLESQTCEERLFTKVERCKAIYNF